MYILKYCYLLYPLSPREAFGLWWFYRIVNVYRIIETFSSGNIEMFDTVSNTNVDVCGGTKSFLTLKIINMLINNSSRDDRPSISV